MLSHTAWECVRASEGARARTKSATAVPTHDAGRLGCSLAALACAVLALMLGPAASGADSSLVAAPDSVARERSTAAPSVSTDSSAHAAIADTSARIRSESAAIADSTASVRLTATPFQLTQVVELIGNGVASGELVEPSGIAVDAFGRIFVGDAARHRVLRLDPSGVVLGQTGSLGSAEGELRRPGSVVLLGTLSVAALDIENRRVLIYDLNDRLQGTLIDFDSPSLRDPLGRIEPRSLAADRGGALYVADAERDRVLAFDFSGRLSRVIGGFGEAAGSFRELAAVAATRRGALYTVERARFRVQRLDPSGVALGAWTFADSGAGRGELAVTADDSLRVAIADEAAGTVRVWDRDGVLLASLEGLGRPRALMFAADGTLLIAEAGLGRLRRFRLERTPPARPAEE